MKKIYVFTMFLLSAIALLVLYGVTMQIAKSRSNSSPYASENNELAYAQGWTEEAETRSWAFVSANAAGNTFVVSVNEDITSFMRPTLRVRVKQGADYQYFIVHFVELDTTNTLITLFGGTDFDLAAGDITDIAWSAERFPYGFPVNENVWAAEYSNNSVQFAGSLSSDVWKNINSASLEVPCAGVWKVSYHVIAEVLFNSTASATIISVTLSDADNTSLVEWEKMQHLVFSLSSIGVSFDLTKTVYLESSQVYYLNTKYFVSGTTASYLANGGDVSPTIIRAVSGYY